MKVVIQDRKTGTKRNITNFVDSVSWSGSVNQASRQIELAVLNSPIDDSIPDVNIKLGDRILFYDEGKLLINAMVYNRERLSDQGTISYSGHDDLKRLCESTGKYNFKNTTPERITKAVCNDIKIAIGKIVATKIPIKKLICDSDKLYAVIMKAYTKAFRANGKKYMPIMVNQKLHVIEKGEVITGFNLDDRTNITSSEYSESIDGMVNKVKIYNDKGKQIGEVKSQGNMDTFGIFQDIYEKEDGVNATTAAKNMLKGVQKSASIEALGNIDCVSGYGIKIRDTVTKLTGVFWIDSDTHTWQNNNHTMSLELTFKNLMDIQEDDEEQKSNKKAEKPQDNTKVYVSKASSKYHSKKTCSGLQGATTITKKEAVKQGKGECTKCWR